MNNILKDKKGNALLMTLMILSGMLVVGLGLTSLIINTIKMGGVQSQSTRAYFAADSGAEKALFDVKQQKYAIDGFPTSSSTDEYTGSLNNGASFSVDYKVNGDIKRYISIGDFGKTRRTVEVAYNMGDNTFAICGNSNVEDGEECDDGNTNDGDGCDSNCQWETKIYTCNPKPEEGTEWNTVSSYNQTCAASDGSTCTSWSPPDDDTTEYNTVSSSESCQYVCSDGYSWNESTSSCE